MQQYLEQATPQLSDPGSKNALLFGTSVGRSRIMLINASLNAPHSSESVAIFRIAHELLNTFRAVKQLSETGAVELPEQLVFDFYILQVNFVDSTVNIRDGTVTSQDLEQHQLRLSTLFDEVLFHYVSLPGVRDLMFASSGMISEGRALFLGIELWNWVFPTFVVNTVPTASEQAYYAALRQGSLQRIQANATDLSLDLQSFPPPERKPPGAPRNFFDELAASYGTQFLTHLRAMRADEQVENSYAVGFFVSQLNYGILATILLPLPDPSITRSNFRAILSNVRNFAQAYSLPIDLLTEFSQIERRISGSSFAAEDLIVIDELLLAWLRRIAVISLFR